MREIKVKVNFEKGTIQKESAKIVSGDYNSTKLVFEFDREDGIKTLEMNDTEDNLLYNGEIVNNEVILVGEDEEGNPCSLFAEEGTYPFEVVLYDGESKLTAVGGKLKITAETVAISDTIVTPQLPVFDQLLGQVSTALNNCEEAVEDIYNAEAEAQEIISDFESDVEDYTAAFNANATSKTNDFNTNAAAKTTAFNDNAASKTETFNTNASEKTSAFNTNAAAKTAYFDSHADSIEKELASLKTTHNAIPKITGEGTEVTLGKTAEATFEKVGLMGNCEQDGEPSPDAPQDIHVVSGDNEIKVCGKNLLKINDFTATSGGLTYECKNGIITVKGTATGTSSQCNFFQYINQEELDSISNETQLTFSVLGISGVSATQIWLGTSSSEYYWQPNATTKMTTRKKTNNISVAKIYISTTIGQKYDIYINPQLEIGSQATSYEPHKEQIKHITLPNGMELAGIGDYRDEIRRSTGKNLFDKDTMTLSNTFVNPTIGSSNGFTSVYVSCKPNTTYSISKAQETSRFYVATTESKPEIGMNATVISSSTTGTVKTFTTGNNANYIIVMVRSSSDTLTEEQIVLGIQIEEGSQATDPEPYGVGVWYKYNKLIKLKMSDIYNKFDNVTQYQNSLNSDNGIISLRMSKSYFSSLNLLESFAYGVSNGFIKSSVARWNNVLGLYKFWYTDGLIFDVLYTDLELNEWKANYDFAILREAINQYLGDIVFYLPAATPTYEPITDTTLISQLDDIYYTMKSYKGQTNISQTPNDAPFYLNVEALYDLEDLLTRVSALEG